MSTLDYAGEAFGKWLMGYGMQKAEDERYDKRRLAEEDRLDKKKLAEEERLRNLAAEAEEAAYQRGQRRKREEAKTEPPKTRETTRKNPQTGKLETIQQSWIADYENGSGQWQDEGEGVPVPPSAFDLTKYREDRKDARASLGPVATKLTTVQVGDQIVTMGADGKPVEVIMPDGTKQPAVSGKNKDFSDYQSLRKEMRLELDSLDDDNKQFLRIAELTGVNPSGKDGAYTATDRRKMLDTMAREEAMASGIDVPNPVAQKPKENAGEVANKEPGASKDNPLPVQDREEAAALPDGTWIILPNGQVGQK